MPRTKELTDSTFLADDHALTQQITSYQALLVERTAQRAALRERARAAGLKAVREVEAPPVVAERVEEPTARVRVREGFSSEWAGIPYDAPAGAVVDLPRGFVAAAAHLFERVPDSTPLHRPAPAAWPR